MYLLYPKSIYFVLICDFILFSDSWLSKGLFELVAHNQHKDSAQKKGWVATHRLEILREKVPDGDALGREAKQLFWKHYIDDGECAQRQ